MPDLIPAFFKAASTQWKQKSLDTAGRSIMFLSNELAVRTGGFWPAHFFTLAACGYGRTVKGGEHKWKRNAKSGWNWKSSRRKSLRAPLQDNRDMKGSPETKVTDSRVTKGSPVTRGDTNRVPFGMTRRPWPNGH